MVEEKELTVSTWNIAAINNNPWEYWITYDGNPKYTQLMVDIEQFIENPQEKDIPVSQIFTQEMFETLVKAMEKEGWTGLEEVRKHWTENYQHRKIISEFLKDSTIGNKRLASMPDRITNTINIIQQEGDNENFVCRPTIINQYEGDLSTTELWFNQWLEFLFEKEITIKTRKGIEKKKISSLLTKIEHSKYPAITPEEEAISIPLQTLCIAIFDCILVHMLNLLAKNDWQPIKNELTSSLNKRKVQRTCEIIEEKYSSSDIVFLQEVASAFISQSKTFFSNDYQNQITILHPENVDYSRDQNSMMILKNNRFDLNSRKEVTEDVIKYLSNLSAKKVPLVAGDLFALTIHSTTNQKYFLASFHGDTDGLATLPVLSALDQFLKEFYPDYSLIFGLDANTYEKSHPSRQGVVEFSKEFSSRGITSCFGDSPNPTNYTTFNARTYLQTQLNKACKSTEIKAKGDVNPKDFILFYSKDFHSNEWLKDNTGNRTYVDDIVYPTLTFPSDHAVLTAVLHQRIESKI